MTSPYRLIEKQEHAGFLWLLPMKARHVADKVIERAGACACPVPDETTPGCYNPTKSSSS
jgi:hypothetical protein